VNLVHLLCCVDVGSGNWGSNKGFLKRQISISVDGKGRKELSLNNSDEKNPARLS